MSASLNCSGCNNPNIKTQKQCKSCVWKKRHPKETEKIFNINAFKKHYAY